MFTKCCFNQLIGIAFAVNRYKKTEIQKLYVKSGQTAELTPKASIELAGIQWD